MLEKQYPDQVKQDDKYRVSLIDKNINSPVKSNLKVVRENLEAQIGCKLSSDRL